MKRAFILSLCMLMLTVASAQTQQGVVKTKGRMVNGQLLPGTKLGGAVISVRGRSAVLSQANGQFSFPVSGQTFMLDSVRKKGYQLVDAEAAPKSYAVSKNPLFLLMETPEQQLQDKLTAERKIRRTLQQQLQKQEENIEHLKTLSQQEKDSLLRILYQQQGNNEKLIADMAKRYAMLDYDQLDEFYRQVSYLIENGELTRADSLLRSRGDINKLVQNIIQHGAAIQEQEEMLQQAKKVHQSDIDEAARRCYSFFETFLAQHLNDSAAYYLELRASLDTTNIDWLHEAGEFIGTYIADYSKAINYFRQGIKQVSLQYGYENDTIASFYNNIGLSYFEQGNYIQALDNLTEALNIRLKIFDSEHQNIAHSYNSLGFYYSELGHYSQALEYLNKALDIQKKVIGIEGEDVAATYNNIGALYARQNDYFKALEFLTLALTLREKALGNVNPDVANSYDNIGVIYASMGDDTKALDFYNKALEIQKIIFGIGHPEVAHTYYNIGSSYCEQGDYAKALQYYLQALDIKIKTFGIWHPDVANTNSQIGYVYSIMKDYSRALEYALKALNIREKLYSPDHADIILSYDNIGAIYLSQSDYSKAQEYYSKALAKTKKTKGIEHPDLIRYFKILGGIFQSKGDYSNALDNLSKALALQKKILGDEHSDIMYTIHNIGDIYTMQGDYQKALTFHAKAIHIQESSQNRGSNSMKSNDSEMMFRVAQLYEHGLNGVGKSIPFAIDWYRMSYQKGHTEDAQNALQRLGVPLVKEKELIKCDSDMVGIWLEKQAKCGKVFLPNGYFFGFRNPNEDSTQSEILDAKFVPTSIGKYKLINRHRYDEELENHNYVTLKKNVVNPLPFSTYRNTMVIFFGNNYIEHWEKQLYETDVINHVMENWNTYKLYIQEQLKMR